MQSTSPEYKGALGTTHTPAATVEVDWDRNGNPVDLDVSRIEVTRSITSDMDNAVTLITGHSVAELEVDLAGDPDDNSKHPAALYSPYRADAPLADTEIEGVPVVASIGLTLPGGDELLTAFTGHLRDVPVNAADRTASLSALDGGSERLMVPPQLPMVVGFDFVTFAAGGLNSQWPVDVMASRGGYNSCPPPRPQCLLSATLHGSAGATVGVMVNASHLELTNDLFVTDAPTPVPYAQGKFALAPTPDHGRQYSFHYNLVDTAFQQPGSHLTFSGWVFFGDDVYPEFDFPLGDEAGAVPELEHVTVKWAARPDAELPGAWVMIGATGPGTTHITVRIARSIADSGAVADGINVDATGWHYVGVSILYSTSVAVVTYRVDDTVVGTESVAITLNSTGDSTLTEADITGVLPCEAVQITTEATTDTGFTWDDAFTPTAILEPGMNELAAIPPLNPNDMCWTLIQQIAAAEAAVALIDELGTFRFWNRRHWWTAPASATVQRTIDATDSLLDCDITRTVDRVRNVIQVPVSPLFVDPNPSIIWQETALLSIPAGGTIVRTADLGQIQATNVNFPGAVIPAGGPISDTLGSTSGYRACTTPDGLGAQVTNLTMTVVGQAGRLVITVTNPNPFVVWLVSPSGGSSPLGGGTFPSASDGKPCLLVVGNAVSTQAPGIDGVSSPDTASGLVAEERWDASIARFGELTLPLQANPWMQQTPSAHALAQAILHDTAWPKPRVDPVSIIADPSLQLGDRVQLVDSSGATGIDDPFWIVEITTEHTGGGEPSAKQTLTCRAVAGPRRWILGITGRSELGVTTIV